MKTNITIEQIAERLTKVFSTPAMLKDYQAEGELSECFGWNGGTMSPLSRPAFVHEFGAHTMVLAEMMARQQLEENGNNYTESNHASHTREAEGAEADHIAPTAGAFVFAIHTGCKCDDGQGLYGEIETAATDDEYMAKRSNDLCKVCRVYEVSAEDFNRPELADELVKSATDKGEEFPGGAANDDTNRTDLLDPYRYYYTLTAAVVCKESGRWFLINSEGYSYARYILMPTNWRTMYAEEVAQAVKKEAERVAAEKAREEQERAERLAQYEEEGKKWADVMEDVTPYLEAEKTAAKNGYRSKEYKGAERATAAVRRRNLVAMGRHPFPGLKVSAKKSDRYATAYDVTYIDGPRLDQFEGATNYGLFVQKVETFNGWDDSTSFRSSEFVEFARKYMAMDYGDIQIVREWSDETSARLIGQVLEVVPMSGDELNKWESPYQWTADDMRAVATITGANASHLLNEWEDHAGRYVRAKDVARWCFDCMDFFTPQPTPQGGKGKKSEPTTQKNEPTEEKSEQKPTTTTTAATAGSVTLSEFSAKAYALKGDTYKYKDELKKFAIWHKRACAWLISKKRKADAVALFGAALVVNVA